jgi:hypothetical protein
MNDAVNPQHYSHPSGIEVIEITQHETFIRGNIIKYIMRAPYKGTELQDLFKAKQYLEWEIERVQEEQWEENWLGHVVQERVSHEEIKQRRERLLKSINSINNCCGK